MYLDRIFNKMYSDEDWDGMTQLFSEIRAFSRETYRGLTEDEEDKLRDRRNNQAWALNLLRNGLNYKLNPKNPSITKITMDERNKALGDLLDDSKKSTKNDVNSARLEHNNKITDKYKKKNRDWEINFYTKNPDRTILDRLEWFVNKKGVLRDADLQAERDAKEDKDYLHLMK